MLVVRPIRAGLHVLTSQPRERERERQFVFGRVEGLGRGVRGLYNSHGGLIWDRRTQSFISLRIHFIKAII
jgi:hypothetical protein